ncbi:MAG: CRISPR-associated endonuclease Cas2 [Gammaproteobacteria bacterium]|nr:CRISPR-associated endonuclease Cas2 [Gammaproteobacteria bacterium]
MKQWYVITYDVREIKRLQKVHYFLKKRAIALQNSVFLLHANQKKLQIILAGIHERVNGRVDDVRLYPVIHPNAIWAAGLQINALQGLYAGTSKTHQPNKQSLIKRLFTVFNRTPQ